MFASQGSRGYISDLSRYEGKMAKTPKGMQIGAAAAPPRPLMNELMTLYKAGRFADVVAKGKPLLCRSASC